MLRYLKIDSVPLVTIDCCQDHVYIKTVFLRSLHLGLFAIVTLVSYAYDSKYLFKSLPLLTLDFNNTSSQLFKRSFVFRAIISLLFKSTSK